MVSFFPFHFFQYSPAQKTFPCGFEGDLGCYVFLKTSMCKYSKKKLGEPCKFVIVTR